MKRSRFSAPQPDAPAPDPSLAVESALRRRRLDDEAASGVAAAAAPAPTAAVQPAAALQPTAPPPAAFAMQPGEAGSWDEDSTAQPAAQPPRQQAPTAAPRGLGATLKLSTLRLKPAAAAAPKAVNPLLALSSAAEEDLAASAQSGRQLSLLRELLPAAAGSSSSSSSSAAANESDALESFMAALPSAPHLPAGGTARASAVTWEEIQAGMVAQPSHAGAGGMQEEEEKKEEGEEEEERYRAAFLAAITATSSAEGASDASAAAAAASAAPATSGAGQAADDDDAALYAGEEWGEETSALDLLARKASKKELPPVDHAAQGYQPFTKAFYRPHPEVARLSSAEVEALQEDLEIKLRGAGALPAPVGSWEHTGLPERILALLAARGYAAPFAIQRQALPVIMSGHDTFAVARTGSGKTLAYLLPLLRQCMDQPPLGPGEGPIGLVLAPSRELVVQIYHEARRLCKALELRCTAVYGGAPVAEQIGGLKRGGEIVAATPGRLIDLLTLNQGRCVSLGRVSYVVIDEADRMFDMGFEPQLAKILACVRPDRQLVMFSATFPGHVEALARGVLKHSPVEVVVGGRSKASPAIAQWVEVREERDKFPRLLQLLGEWYESGGGILVFVDTKEHADLLWAELNRRGYPAAALHGGQEQVDRDQTLADFKAGIRTLLVATGVAGRGLDVKHLTLVVNYACPNHLEEYVHRVGRTGRAGAKGTAFTFITPSEGSYAKDCLKVLKDAGQEAHIPEELRALAASHAAAVAAGTAKHRASGFTGSRGGFKFDRSEVGAGERERREQRAVYEGEVVVEEGREEEEEEGGGGGKDRPAAGGSGGGGTAAGSEAAAAAGAGAGAPPTTNPAASSTAAAAVAAAVAYISRQMGSGAAGAAAGAGSGEAALAAGSGGSGSGVLGSSAVAAEEMDINDYPQQARTKLLKEGTRRVEESTGAAVTCKGMFVPPGKAPPPGERRLHLLIEATTEFAVKRARVELRRILEEETMRIGAAASTAHYSKYQV